MKATEFRLGNLYQWLHEEHETIEVADIYFLTTQQTYNNDPEDEIFCRGWWADSIPLLDVFFILLCPLGRLWV